MASCLRQPLRKQILVDVNGSHWWGGNGQSMRLFGESEDQ